MRNGWCSLTPGAMNPRPLPAVYLALVVFVALPHPFVFSEWRQESIGGSKKLIPPLQYRFSSFTTPFPHAAADFCIKYLGALPVDAQAGILARRNASAAAEARGVRFMSTLSGRSLVSSDAYFFHDYDPSKEPTSHQQQQQQPPPAASHHAAGQEAARLGFATSDLDPLALRLIADGVPFSAQHRQEHLHGSEFPSLLVELPGGITIQVKGQRLTAKQPGEQQQQLGARPSSNGTAEDAEEALRTAPSPSPLPPLRPLTVSHLSYTSSQLSAAADFLHRVTGAELTDSRDAGSGREVKKLRLPRFELQVVPAGQHHHQRQQQQEDVQLEAASLGLCIGFEVASLKPFLESLDGLADGEPHEYVLLGPGAQRGGCLPRGAAPRSLVVRGPDGLALELMLRGTAAARGPAALAPDAAEGHDRSSSSSSREEAAKMTRALSREGPDYSTLSDQQGVGTQGETPLELWQQQQHQQQQNHHQQQKQWEERIRQRQEKQKHQKQQQKHWEDRIRQRRNMQEEEDERRKQLPLIAYRFSSFATPAPHKAADFCIKYFGGRPISDLEEFFAHLEAGEGAIVRGVRFKSRPPVQKGAETAQSPGFSDVYFVWDPTKPSGTWLSVAEYAEKLEKTHKFDLWKAWDWFQDTHLGFRTTNLDPLAFRLLRDRVPFVARGGASLFVGVPGGITVHIQGNSLKAVRTQGWDHCDVNNATTARPQPPPKAKAPGQLPPLGEFYISHFTFASTRPQAAVDFLEKVFGLRGSKTRDECAEIRWVGVNDFGVHLVRQWTKHEGGLMTVQGVEQYLTRLHGNMSRLDAFMDFRLGFEVVSLEPFCERLDLKGEPYLLLGREGDGPVGGQQLGEGSSSSSSNSSRSLLIQAPGGLIFELTTASTLSSRSNGTSTETPSPESSSVASVATREDEGLWHSERRARAQALSRHAEWRRSVARARANSQQRAYSFAPGPGPDGMLVSEQCPALVADELFSGGGMEAAMSPSQQCGAAEVKQRER